jgi:hypothetical protein
MVGYISSTYLLNLSDSVSAQRGFVQDCLFMRKIVNYRVLCPNVMIGMRPRPLRGGERDGQNMGGKSGPPLAGCIQNDGGSYHEDISNPESRYTHPPKQSGRPPFRGQNMTRACSALSGRVAALRHWQGVMLLLVWQAAATAPPVTVDVCMGVGTMRCQVWVGGASHGLPPDIGGCFGGTICTTKEGKETF